ncbi:MULTISPECIES: hypothetical protein [unclassified Polaromonas]|uniref:hypothetical protein n=1 Tax=unclassified Polaromonas TaxID=2638319 RepID=UPI0018C90917|nr:MULTISPECIES: hypothetical protein [unclassified Polaromonas]MBG6073891.1 hypothetical protein [Polaromonas sp. CG_9.7]MBG6115930.1 hypothetical protein [Polaromonas sp. CG_9.2]MDH6183355.1 hypothetical protein [Polaromonas sp. CG_23.6]
MELTSPDAANRLNRLSLLKRRPLVDADFSDRMTAMGRTLQRIALTEQPFPMLEQSVAGAAVIEIVAALLTVKLLVPMPGLEQAVPEVD